MLSIDGKLQNQISAVVMVILAIPSLLALFSAAWPGLMEQMAPALSMLPEEIRGIVVAILAVVIFVALAWNYLSSVWFGDEKKEEGIQRGIELAAGSPVKSEPPVDNPDNEGGAK